MKHLCDTCRIFHENKRKFAGDAGHQNYHYCIDGLGLNPKLEDNGSGFDVVECPEYTNRIKPIETYYNGYRFRSRLEARWAVLLDAIRADWEYEPEGFDLGDGTYYLPDFRIKARKGAGGRTPEVFYLEVKGVPTKEDGEKCKKFAEHYPLLIVGELPRVHGDCTGTLHDYFNVDDDGCKEDCIRDSFYYVDGDKGPCLLCASVGGGVGLYGPDWYWGEEGEPDEEKTIDAYNKARQARFEHGETPKV